MFGIDKMAPLLLRIKLPQIFVIFKNGWLFTAASEESEIAAFHVIRFLTHNKNSFRYSFLTELKISKNSHLRAYTLYRISLTMRSLEIRTQRIFNYLTKQNMKLGSDSVLNQ